MESSVLLLLLTFQISSHSCFFFSLPCSTCCLVEMRISFNSAWNETSSIVLPRNLLKANAALSSLPWAMSQRGLSGKKMSEIDWTVGAIKKSARGIR